MFIGDAKLMIEADASYRSGKSDTADYLLKNMVDDVIHTLPASSQFKTPEQALKEWRERYNLE